MNILIGGAWPYANGSLHIGHVAALLPGDVIARYYRAKGDNVLYVSGSDCHGTPISIRAKQEGVSPKVITNKYHQEFEECFRKLNFSYDLYGRTDDEFHKKSVQEIIRLLHKNEFIYEKEVEQIYCEHCNQFLPDRYVEGVCPKCNSKARGDQCDSCGSLLDPLELFERSCKLCGKEPSVKVNKQLYFALSKFQALFEENIKNVGDNWKLNAVNSTKRYLQEGLCDRAISRDLSWGIDIPIEGFEDKKVYVWIDAVLGYFTMSQKWALENNKSYKDFWSEDSISYYIHGKDNIPFHSIILPALINGIGINKFSDKMISSEYVTLEGKKISTSNDWALWIPDLLSRYEADVLRYFFLINAPEKRDTDFSWREFVNRNNGELLGAYGNLVNRTLVFAKKFFDSKVPSGKIDCVLSNAILELYNLVGDSVEQGNLKCALERIFEFIRGINKYFDEKTPWLTIKNDKDECINTIYNCIYAIVNIANLLEPFLPESSCKIKSWFGFKENTWRNLDLISNIEFGEIEVLFERIDKEVIELELERLKKR